MNAKIIGDELRSLAMLNHASIVGYASIESPICFREKK